MGMYVKYFSARYCFEGKGVSGPTVKLAWKLQLPHFSSESLKDEIIFCVIEKSNLVRPGGAATDVARSVSRNEMLKC